MTDDLPTPPLPDDTAITRVRESMNGFTRGSGRCPAWDASTTCNGFATCPLSTAATPRISVSFMSRTSTSTRRMPGTSPTCSITRRVSSARLSSPGKRHGQRHHRGAPVDRHPLHQAELGDRPPQLGLLNRRQRHARRRRERACCASIVRAVALGSGGRGISTTGIGRIQPWSPNNRSQGSPTRSSTRR